MPSPPLSPADERAVVAAITAAERGHPAEIRLHIERRCDGDPLAQARRRFYELGMHRTRAGTGVLLYVALSARRAAVYAGPGVYPHIDPSAWQPIVDAVTAGYAQGTPAAGLCAALARVGELLRAAIPGDDPAGDELPDAVSYT
ncbi:MAG: TPM domain-containing protein [bacterium]|nr:TPM domain-containing protein [Myxococcales bacterium]MCB9543712.1 TPM domain-containing protein [Myxococcales bacterium]MCB9551359.1 TPM domain-containing protein [Myxococcales bacterium]